MLDYGQKQNCIVWFISPPRSQWVPRCLNTRLEPSSCLSVSLENWMSASISLGQIKQLEWAQDSSYDYILFFLSFVNLATLEQLGRWSACCVNDCETNKTNPKVTLSKLASSIGRQYACTSTIYISDPLCEECCWGDSSKYNTIQTL